MKLKEKLKMWRYLSTKEGNRMKGTSGAKKTSTKTTTDEEEITSTSVEPKSAEKPVEETKSPAEQVQKTATPTGNNQPTTENKNPDYTMDDVVSVAETGSLPPVEPKSAYDLYMEEAKNIYNQGVETNNKNAANQAASAGAQYREVNRNVGEINKANGKADTGYAGDTSIDAYNAYRNSVNKSYSDANSANNELYSYYLTKMTELQQAKDNKEATDRQLEQTDRQLDMQEQQYQDEKETNVVSEVSGMLAEDGAFNTDGSITNETAQKTWDYITRIYGENVPESTMAYLESQEGFSEWLEAYNSGADGENSALNDYIDKHENPVLSMETQEGYRGADNTYGKVNIQGFGSTDRQNNDIDVSIGGTEYDLRMGNPAKKEYSDILDNLLAKQGKSKSPKTTAVYDGHLFIVDHGGTWRQMMSDNSNINDAVSAYIKVASGK